jgi:hypothetical protein
MSIDPPSQQPALEGTLMLKYVPRTGEWASRRYVCHAGRNCEMEQAGVGNDCFSPCRVVGLPTMYHVVDALPVLAARSGSIARTRGGESYRDTRILS